MGIGIYGNAQQAARAAVGSVRTGITATATQVQTPAEQMANAVNNVSNSVLFGCPQGELLPTEPPPDVAEPEEQGNQVIDVVRNFGPSQFFLAPSSVIDSPATQISRIKTVINQSLFFAKGRDLSAQEISDTAGRLVRPTLVRYAEEADNFLSVGSRTRMDGFRYILGSFWTLAHTDQGMISAPRMYEPGTDNTVGTTFPDNHMFRNIYARELNNDNTKFIITMRPNYDFFRPGLQGLSYDRGHAASLREYVFGGDSVQQTDYPERYERPMIEAQSFFDYVHDVKMPLFSEEMENANTGGRLLDASIKLESNYRLPEGAFIGGTFVASPYRLHNSDEEDVVLQDGIFYSENRRPNDSVLAFTPSHIKKFPEIYKEYKDLYPSTVCLDFATSQGGEMPRILKTQSSVVKDLAMRFVNSAATVGTYAEVISETIEEARSDSDEDTPGIDMQNDKFVQEQDLEHYHPIDILDLRTPAVLNMENFPLHKTVEQPADPDSPSNALSRVFERLERAVSIAKVREIESTKYRKFTDILKGRKSYSEPIAYLVEKHDSDRNGQSKGVLQRFLFMDNDDVDRIQFLDPQLINKKTYSYRVFVLNLVVGSEYMYEKVTLPNTVDAFQSVTVPSAFYYANFGGNRESAYTFSPDQGEYTNVATQEVFEGDVEGFRQFTMILKSDTYKGIDQVSAQIRSNIEPEPAYPGRVIWISTPSSLNNPTEIDVRREIQARRERLVLVGMRNAGTGRGAVGNDLGSVGARLEHIQNEPSSEHRNGFNDLITIAGTCVPRALVVKVPYFRKDIFVDDDPPLSPDIDIVPYKGITNRIKIIMTSRTGEEMATPVVFAAMDLQRFDDARRAQDVKQGHPIRFSSDDPPSLYEVYRTTTPPESYDDFSQNLHTRVTTIGSAASLIDTVEPNVKYYYTFRSIDASNHVSNPGKVFCAQLVSTDDGMYLDWSVYKFPRIVTEDSLSFNQYVSIRAAQQQLLPDPESQRGADGDTQLEQPEDLSPGPRDRRVWNRKFVVRIKSKNSGNVLDVKFTCQNLKIDERDPVQPQSSTDSNTPPTKQKTTKTSSKSGIVWEGEGKVKKKMVPSTGE